MAQWDSAYINNLPDSSFGYIAPGGEKDDENKTTPRSLRHLPYKDADGKVDLPHLRNALSRLPQTDLPAAVKDRVRSKLEKIAQNNGVETQDADNGQTWNDSVTTPTVEIPVECIYTRILAVGDYTDNPQFPGFQCTDEWCAQVKANFDQRLIWPVPLMVDHAKTGQGTAAAGWITSLDHRMGDGLYINIELTPLGKEMATNGLYKGFSAGWMWNFIDETGVEHGPTLMEASFTNQRAFQKGAPAMASTVEKESARIYIPLTNDSLMPKKKAAKAEASKEVKTADYAAPVKPEMPTDANPMEKKSDMGTEMPSMDLNAVRKIDPDKLTQAEAEFLSAHWSDLTPEEQSKFQAVVDKVMGTPEEKDEETKPAMEASKAKASKDPEEQVDEPVVENASIGAPSLEKAAKSVENVGKTEAVIANEKQMAELKAKAEKAEAELKGLKVEADLDKNYLLPSAAGKFLPAAKPFLKSLFLSLNEAQRKDFDKAIGYLGKGVITAEIGSAAAPAVDEKMDVRKLMDEKIAEAAKRSEALDPVEAFKSLVRENPDRFKKK